jgi:hypothetical protein
MIVVWMSKLLMQGEDRWSKDSVIVWWFESVEKSSCELVSIKTVVAYAMLDAIISCNIPLTSASELLCIRQASSNNRCMRSTTSRLYKICRNTTRLREDQLIGLMACGLRDVITWVAGDNFRQLLVFFFNCLDLIRSVWESFPCNFCIVL